MATGKEIRTQIGSIQNTQKITRAMEMVAASKMRKAQDRVTATRPYARKIRQVISHLAGAHSEYHHPYMTSREVKRVGVILISTDRGLCGGLNTNLFKRLITSMKEWHDLAVETDLCIIGSKGVGFFTRLGGNLVGEATHLGDEPELSDIIGTVKVMLDAYTEGRIDSLYLGYNEFINTMTQSPQLDQVLPLENLDQDPSAKIWDYLYEPDAREVLEALLTRYVESIVYQGVVENGACEQAARMVAMKSASDNAENLIEELQLVYNKARQAAITQELAEIVAGADAV